MMVRHRGIVVVVALIAAMIGTGPWLPPKADDLAQARASAAADTRIGEDGVI